MSALWSWIEASAGTGKTYTIVQTILNLLCEQEITSDRILVVTFTEKATAELKTRIREGLQRHRNSLDRQSEAYRRTQTAIESIAEMTITTIHGFCQKLLSTMVLESGLTFDAKVVSSRSSWTKRIEAFLRAHPNASSADLLRRCGFLSGRELIDVVLSALNEKIFEGEILYPTEAQTSDVEAWFDEAVGETGPVRSILRELRDSSSDWPTSWKRAFGEERVRSFNGTTIKKGYRILREMTLCESETEFVSLLDEDSLDMLGRWSPDAAKSYVKQVPTSCELYDRIVDSCSRLERALAPLLEVFGQPLGKRLRTTLRVKTVRRFVEALTNAKGTAWDADASELTFDSMISRVHESVRDPDGAFCQAASGRWDAVLVDEFQDTDRLQWEIFRTCFARAKTRLTLVGDGKQSIYFFRGADVNVYREAGRFFIEHGARRVVLNDNYRSTEELLDAFNRTFSQVFPEGDYVPSEKGSNTIERLRGLDHALEAVLLEGDVGTSSVQKSAAWIRYCVSRVVDLLSGDERLSDRRVLASDILILTESNQQSNLVYRWLTEKNVPAVVQTKEGLFASPEAREILLLFKALENPRDPSKAKALVLTRIFRWSTTDLSLSPELIERVQNALIDAQNDRANGRFLSAFRRVASTFESEGYESGGLEHVLSNERGFRTLTNWEHLLEILQERVRDGIASADRIAIYLESCIEEGSWGDEEIDLRLDRDSRAVRILTIHKAKGLESPIVFFCPSFSPLTVRGEWTISTRNGQKSVDFFASEEGISLWKEHAHEEAVRLYYVALTRAKTYAVVPAFAPAQTRWERFLRSAGLTETIRRPAMTRASWQASPSLEIRLEESERTEPFGGKLLDPKFPIADRFPVLESHSGLLRRHAYAHAQTVDLAESSLRREDEAPNEGAVGESPLPAGPAFGTLVHDLLERWDFTWFAEGSRQGRDRARAELEDLCERRRAVVFLGSKQRQSLFELLERTLTSELTLDGKAMKLCDVPVSRTRREVEFHVRLRSQKPTSFTWSGFDRRAPERESTWTVRPGFLTGRIDLIFEWNEKLYVLDWKTNLLGSRDELNDVMSQSYYDLQAMWYWNALGSLAKTHERGRSAGGIVYCFLRGPLGKPEFWSIDPETLERSNAMNALFSEAT